MFNDVTVVTTAEPGYLPNLYRWYSGGGAGGISPIFNIIDDD